MYSPPRFYQKRCIAFVAAGCRLYTMPVETNSEQVITAIPFRRPFPLLQLPSHILLATLFIKCCTTTNTQESLKGSYWEPSNRSSRIMTLSGARRVRAGPSNAVLSKGGEVCLRFKSDGQKHSFTLMKYQKNLSHQLGAKSLEMVTRL